MFFITINTSLSRVLPNLANAANLPCSPRRKIGTMGVLVKRGITFPARLYKKQREAGITHS
jgi:hypothetical protein